MSISDDSSAVIAKTKELCSAIAEDSTFIALQKQVEAFLNDDAAKLQYQSVHERGEELHNKQHSGIQLGQEEIKEFEDAREALLENDTARLFLEAQQELEGLQRMIGKYVGKTLELGRMPTSEELEGSNGGCCGGGGGGGCGCSH
nr:YlbF family regulator [Verrucomicrobiota bacterium JB025]